MSDTILSCTCCGRKMVFPADCALLECPACSTRNARPRSTGAALETLQRAVEQRLACDFHNAERSYQQVLLFNPDEHEALWGLLLCRYGVEYVEDPATKRRMPTVHSVQAKPLQEQADFIKACEFAPDSVRTQYEQEAAYIDDAQAHIRQLAKSCQPYDVFLCHKTTKPGSGDKTEDFHRATQLYHFLKDQGVRVFFAPESLQAAAGANYEAGIYHALHTAQVMLVVCSNEDYLTSAWVRSEWSRYLELMDEAPDRQLIPLLYDHFDPANLPAPFRFRRLQGLDMTEITAAQTLMDVVEKAVVHEKKPAAKPPKAQQQRPEPVKPQPEPVAPPAKFTHFVTLNFPGLRPHWATVPEWVILAADKKTVIADVKWDSTMKVPIESERTQLFFADKKYFELRKNARMVFLIALFIAFILIAVIIANGFNVGIAILAGISAYIALLGGIISFSPPSRPCIVTSGKSYNLTWRWAKSNNNFKVEEY